MGRLLLGRAEHRQAVRARQSQIGNHQIERPPPDGVETFRAGCRRFHFMADGFQRIDHRESHQRLVIHEQNSKPLHDTLSSNERSRETGR